MRLDQFYNPTIFRTNLDTGSDIRLTRKLAKFLIETSSKVYKLKTYDETIDNSIHGNKWHKAINKKL